ncbi:mitochondrial carrier protein MTM1 isoform X1 [Dendrobium catenatum]|nr:mitochondrial carrier protein MTM1 isoform X1 [Dendrobium catenatum]
MADSASQLNTNFPSASPSTSPSNPVGSLSSDSVMGFGERTISAAGAAVLSAIVVNPLDVAKTRLQAQAAGVPYHPTRNCTGGHMASRNTNLMFSNFRCPPSRTCECLLTAETASLPECSRYKGTFDVLFKVIRQEGYARLWRGTNASLALAIPTVGIYLPCYDIFRNWFEEFAAKSSPHLTPYAPLIAGSAARSLACIVCSPIELARTRMQAFRELQRGEKPSGVWKTLLGVLSPTGSTKYPQNFGGYRVLWMGVGAQIARDVPFSAICWSTLEPIRRSLLGLVEEEGSPIAIFGANFTAGFVAGSLAAAATCPLDVAKTRRQIEKDPTRAQKSNTWRTLSDVWRSGGLRGLFTGVGPRVGRAGPSVGIVVSFYEVVKHILHQRHKNSPEVIA